MFEKPTQPNTCQKYKHTKTVRSTDVATYVRQLVQMLYMCLLQKHKIATHVLKVHTKNAECGTYANAYVGV